MTDGDNRGTAAARPWSLTSTSGIGLLIILKCVKLPLIFSDPNPLPDHPAISERTFHDPQNKGLNLKRTC